MRSYTEYSQNGGRKTSERKWVFWGRAGKGCDRCDGGGVGEERPQIGEVMAGHCGGRGSWEERPGIGEVMAGRERGGWGD